MGAYNEEGNELMARATTAQLRLQVGKQLTADVSISDFLAARSPSAFSRGASAIV